jgi:hypothetical protein
MWLTPQHLWIVPLGLRPLPLCGISPLAELPLVAGHATPDLFPLVLTLLGPGERTIVLSLGTTFVPPCCTTMCPNRVNVLAIITL